MTTAETFSEIIFPLDFCGTLTARDGIKTGSGTPNGEDAYDKKLVCVRITRASTVLMSHKPKIKTFEDHATDGRVRPIDCCMTIGATRNGNPSNNNPLILIERNLK